MRTTLIRFLLAELKHLGVKDIFGVPGDYAFPIDDAVMTDPELRWIGCCNELNAAYAADGYARIKGLSVLCTTFGVGELSAMGGIAGAYAEHLPVIHLVGIPPSSSIRARRVMHHTLGTGHFELYAKMTAPIVAAGAILTPSNATSEIRRVLQSVLRQRRPGYLAIPMDYADAILEAAPPHLSPEFPSNRTVLAQAVRRAAAMLNQATAPVVLPGYLIQRLRLQEEVTHLLETGTLPFATMMMDKGVLNEELPNFLGIYDGELLPGTVQQRVEEADCVLNLGALWSDFNTGTFTARLQRERVIVAGLHQVTIDTVVYHDVEFADFIAALSKKLKPHHAAASHAAMPEFAPPDRNGYIDDFYRQLTAFLRPDDLLVVDTGTPALAMSTARLPANCRFLNQTLWGAIGWATPAAFGAALASPGRRVILLTGEGAHQLTAQEISQFQRHKLPILTFVINNGGYQIERILDLNPNWHYNDLPAWNYLQLPGAFGCDKVFTALITDAASAARVFGQLDQATFGAYVEVVTTKTDLPTAARVFKKAHHTLYN